MKTYRLYLKDGRNYTYRAASYFVHADGALTLMADHKGHSADAVFVVAAGEWSYLRLVGNPPELLAGEVTP